MNNSSLFVPIPTQLCRKIEDAMLHVMIEERCESPWQQLGSHLWKESNMQKPHFFFFFLNTFLTRCLLNMALHSLLSLSNSSIKSFSRSKTEQTSSSSLLLCRNNCWRKSSMVKEKEKLKTSKQVLFIKISIGNVVLMKWNLIQEKELFKLALTWVLRFGAHCHCTLEMLQVSTLHVCPKNLSLQPPRIWLAHICLICFL